MKNKIFLVIFFCLAKISFANQFAIFNGYTDKLSYRSGETVTFFISGFSFNETDNLTLFDMNGVAVETIADVPITVQVPTTTNPWEDGFGYTATITWIVPSTLKSGRYFIATDNPDTPEIAFIVKAPLNTSDIVIVVPTNTINAYNNIGGMGMYTGAKIVSFLRPQVKDRMVDFLGSHGFIDGFLSWMALSAQQTQYNINVISDMDLDDPAELNGAKVIIVIGHSEYWTREARINFDEFVDNGHDAIVLSGNTMWWQVRYNSDKTKLICYKSVDPSVLDADEQNPLLKTSKWYLPNLKYSILSSIGADSHHGGFGIGGVAGTEPHNFCDYGGFNGYKIAIPNSPILNGSWQGLNITPFSQGDYLIGAVGEYDGTLVKRDANDNAILDNDGYPILDVSALGFYRAELIGYDQTWVTDDDQNLNYLELNPMPSPNGHFEYCPLMIFQKTCLTGKVINVNSNNWCSNIGIGGQNLTLPNSIQNCSTTVINTDPRIKQITKNMIDLLLAGNNVFANPAPTGFSITPASSTVSYEACANGSITISPCGVTMVEGHKIDHTAFMSGGSQVQNGEGSLSGSIDGNCTNYQKRLSNNDNENTTLNEIEKAEAMQLDKNKMKQVEIKNNQNIVFQKGDNTDIQSAQVNLKNQVNTFPNFTIIPNPNRGQFIIYNSIAQPCNICIINTLGTTVFETKTFDSNTTIDISQYSKGIYFVKLTTENKTDVKRIIVE